MRRHLLWLWLITACGGSPQVYGVAVDPEEVRQEAKPLKSGLSETEVTLSGTVGEVCPMGCWFYLLGDTDMVYVELDLGSGFVIPKDSAGRPAVVRGRVRLEDAALRLKAETVVLYSR
ncbi:MAG: DUF4920 domain-containing protein [Myxococcota bacterium]|nr:DUF4920 domain-containing protein [Myxococcota bacterium]